ncbi:hypothetical protein N7489_011883 [Penicillium chrysogenum]|uniref:Uncharacterized protein n=1 Tax=Penicillium chrysogenum TaxID=5076 RepID=A0ABQ8W0U0_PENCH|nr:uncharacterized protein N7489_011883 [Penicillium chrysogenum]KAJ5231175.1 hypothetical protein N7489_011883 [Penicillium chrysogenum]KAJ5253502.1 hypothetical protein N7505_012165 [Penicillium chrysogenum]KAJ5260912.1 hypothetical protein N7524_008545 [Penicillium chrysogenum]KAJ6162681.1 hypothetical protein N7497_002660 [Penicillium chrysogenum]
MYTKYGGLYVGGLRCVDPQRLIEQSEPRMTTVVGSISFRRFFVERIDGQFDGGLDVGCACWMIDCEGSPDCFSSPGTCRRTVSFALSLASSVAPDYLIRMPRAEQPWRGPDR